MAGLGFKDFAVGAVLTAADVDGYLMQQSVMRFADSAARGSALGTAAGTGVALAEGMVSYLDDVNAVQVYTGSGWFATGVVKQVKTATRATSFTISSSSLTDVPDTDVSITPTSASSSLLILVTVPRSLSAAGSTATIEVFDATASASVFSYVDGRADGAGTQTSSGSIVISAGTAVARTYRVRASASSGNLVASVNGSPTTLTVIEFTP